MSVVHIVESAESRPHACAQCGESRGPFVDTVVDLIEGRLYLCMMCLRLDAAEAGFAEGHRMDELVDSKATVEHAEHELDDRNQQIRQLKASLKERDKSLTEIQSYAEQLEGEIKRKDHLAQQAADRALEVIQPAEQPVTGLGVAG